MRKNMKKMKIDIPYDPICENCGYLEPYTILWDSTVCLFCAVEYPDYDLTEEEEIFIKETEREKKLEYFKKRLNEI